MNISISLTPELIGFIKTKLDSGRYTSTSEVIREALRVLERVDQREVRDLPSLRTAWKEGIESGDAGPLDIEAIKAEGRRRLGRVSNR